MIRITAKQDGFRRCGVAHSKQATEHPDKAFTAAELKILQAEPMLVVVITEGIGEEKRLNAKDTIAQVKTIETIEALVSLAAENADRQSVLDAISKRRGELETHPE